MVNKNWKGMDISLSYYTQSSSSFSQLSNQYVLRVWDMETTVRYIKKLQNFSIGAHEILEVQYGQRGE